MTEAELRLSQVEGAIRSHFGTSAAVARGQLRELFRRGRTSLLIGWPSCRLSIALGRLSHDWLPAGSLGEILREGLLIGGWVAMWGPMQQIFLYDWWPLAHASSCSTGSRACRHASITGAAPTEVLAAGGRGRCRGRPPSAYPHLDAQPLDGVACRAQRREQGGVSWRILTPMAGLPTSRHQLSSSTGPAWTCARRPGCSSGRMTASICCDWRMRAATRAVRGWPGRPAAG